MHLIHTSRCPAVWVRILLICTLACTSLQGQNPYTLSWGVDAPLIGLGSATLGASYAFAKRHPAFKADQIDPLPNFKGPNMDRMSLKYWSPRAKRASDAFLYTSVALPALVLLTPSVRQAGWGTAAVIGTETILVSSAFTKLTKNLVGRTRPFVYNPHAPLSAKLTKDARESFFSGHTSLSAAACFAGASVYSAYHPNSSSRRWVWLGAITLPAATGYLRIRAGKHFPTDVLAGYAVGALCGWAIPRLHKAK